MPALAKGFESQEAEIIERSQRMRICEAYACAELATTRALGADYCAMHAPPSGSIATPGEASL